ncbi:uncharacterized protein LOC106732083 [Pelodiscus sinensis]|uniref:uncharacterized protein LOC106732083 n=1 Tax=Pelodiscus sinensis TaxID=13735 RepID=UPI003F6AB4AD
MPGSPGFKRCIHCKEAMPASDGHEACVRCLGESHVPQKCSHCAKLTPRARRERDMRLKLLLCDKALQPSEQHLSGAPGGHDNRAKSPPATGTQKKRASPARSLPPPSLSRVSQGHKQGASGAARQPERSNKPQAATSSRTSSAPAIRPAESATDKQRSAPLQGLEPRQSAQPRVRTAPQMPALSQGKPAPGPAPDATLPHGTAELSEHNKQSAPLRADSAPADQLAAATAPQEQLPGVPARAVTQQHEAVLLSPPPAHSSLSVQGGETPSVSAVPTKAAKKSVTRHSISPSLEPSISPSHSPSITHRTSSHHQTRSPRCRSRSRYSDRHGRCHRYYRESSYRSRSPSYSPPRSYHRRYASRYSSRRSSPDHPDHRGHQVSEYERHHYRPGHCCCHTPHESRQLSPIKDWKGASSRQHTHSPSVQLSEPEEGQISDVDDQLHNMSQKDMSSSYPDDALFEGEPSPPDDTKDFQDLFRRVAQSQEVQILDTPTKQFKLWRNLNPKQQSKVALPMDEAILQSAAEIWRTPASTLPTSKPAEKRYFIASKDSEFLFTHPQPNSLVVDAALQRAKNPQLKNAGIDKEAKKLDAFGRKVYTSATLLLRIANYTALLANHSFDSITKLTELSQRSSETDRELLRSILKEGYACSKANLQIAMDIADTAARGVATAVSMRRSSWLATAAVPKELHSKVEDLPFDKIKLFAEKTDEILHTGKDSRTTLRTLGMYAPPFRRRRYFPYQRRYDYQSRRQQNRPFDQARSRQRPQRRRPPPPRVTGTAASKQQV